MAKKAREETVLQFREEVEAEVDFLKTFPIMDNSARKMAEKVRENQRAEKRAEMRAHKGPILFSKEAKKAEKERLRNLRKQFNRASARRSKIRREAEYLYQAWANPILEDMTKKADCEIIELDLQQLELKDTIALAMEKIKKFREKSDNKTGNGSTGSGSGTSAFTMGTR